MRITFLPILVAAFLVSFVCQNARGDEPPFKVRMEILTVPHLATGRPSVVNTWFPEGQCSGSTQRFCLSEHAVVDKVLVFSHGSMGSALDYRWIGERMAQRGYVVLGVNHYGESSSYGPGSIDPRSVTLIWQRAQDISALLDTLTQRQVFSRDVNWSSIVAIGHSAGGQTASMLAGATFDLQRVVDYCASTLAENDRTCRYAQNAAAAPQSFRKQYQVSQQDSRIRLLILLDPALGPALITERAADISAPTLVVGALNNDFIPWGNHGSRYAKAISGAETFLLTGQEGHFTFLAACTQTTRVMGVALCADLPGVDRTATQAALADVMTRFIQTHAAAFSEQRVVVPTRNQQRMYRRPSVLGEILTYTPTWVYFLLVVLAALGIWQARDREIAWQRALVLPAAMLALSFAGVINYFGLDAASIVCWLVGLIVTATLVFRSIDSEDVTYDASIRKLRIRGSYWPLFVILGIFFTRYALGVANGMDLAIVREPHFHQLMSGILGGWSGYFLARAAFCYLQFRKARGQELASNVAHD